MAETGAEILVVDDSRSMRLFIAAALTQAGYTCDAAEDGSQALMFALRQPYRLVVTDHDMPGVDGTRLVARLRAGDKTRDVPVIMLTARAETDVVREAVGAGVTAYLLKPFKAEALLEKVKAVLASRPKPESPY